MRPLAAAVTLLVVVVAACNGGPTTPTNTPGTSQALPTLGLPTPGPASPGTTSAATRPPGATASGSRPSSSPVAITPFHLAPDLEQLLPTSAGGQSLTVESIVQASFSDGNGRHTIGIRCRWYENRGLRCRDQKELAAALAALGKAPQDVVIAVAYDMTRGKEVEIQATRVAGATGEQTRAAVLAALSDASAKSGHPLNVTTATVGGKSVSVISYTTSYPLGLSRWLYASADTLFDVRRADDPVAAEILQSLP
jgi:hypothetical protein